MPYQRREVHHVSGAEFLVESRDEGLLVLHDLEPAMDLPAQVGAGEIVAGEYGAYGAAQFFERSVGGVLRTAAGEVPQDLLGLGGAEAERGGA
ncbi:hypothetical protein GCM10023195_86740 [Actinoallomurus liliacearum]|uniref:Uncharacterized protein n=1 Tax=Actinoallomurus liliacearum TaxID=1080073 RepID=A0ABP8TXY6_9ACTN